MSITTRTEAEQHIITSIEGSGVASHDEFDVPAIADAIYTENGGTWDITDFDVDRFWELVKANER